MTAAANDPLTAPIKEVDPNAQVRYRLPGDGSAEVRRKTRLALDTHVALFGPLGEFQTEQQKKNLAKVIAAQDAEGGDPS